MYVVCDEITLLFYVRIDHCDLSRAMTERTVFDATSILNLYATNYVTGIYRKKNLIWTAQPKFRPSRRSNRSPLTSTANFRTIICFLSTQDFSLPFSHP